MKIATILKDNYYIAFETLAYTLKKHCKGELPEFHIIHDGNLGSVWEVGEMGFKIFRYDANVLAPPIDAPEVAPRISWNWNKLKSFCLPEGKYVYMDADMICMSPWEELEQYDDFAICEDSLPHTYNAGLFVFDASLDSYRSLLDLIEVMKKEGQKFKNAEQSVLAHWLERGLHPFTILPRKFNMFNKDFTRRPEKWDPKEAVFIHYLGPVKPWDSDVYWGPDRIWKDIRREYESSYVD